MEIAALEMRLKMLNEKAGLSEDSVADTERENARLRESVHNQQLSLATAQSVVSGLLVRLWLDSECLEYACHSMVSDADVIARTASKRTR